MTTHDLETGTRGCCGTMPTRANIVPTCSVSLQPSGRSRRHSTRSSYILIFQCLLKIPPLGPLNGKISPLSYLLGHMTTKFGFGKHGLAFAQGQLLVQASLA